MLALKWILETTFLFYKWGNWGSEKLHDFFNITQAIVSRAKIELRPLIELSPIQHTIFLPLSAFVKCLSLQYLFWLNKIEKPFAKCAPTKMSSGRESQMSRSEGVNVKGIWVEHWQSLENQWFNSHLELKLYCSIRKYRRTFRIWF